MGSRQTSTDPTVIFVLGLLGLLACQIMGPVAWLMGNAYVSECRALGIQPDGLATAGRVLGIVSTVLMALSLVAVVLYFLFIFLIVGAAVVSEM